MFYKNKSFFSICLLLCLFSFQLSSEISSKPLEEFSSELKRDFDATKIVSFDLVLLFLQYGYEICTAIEKIDPKISSQLGVQCKGCQNKVLSCAEFAGHLLACGVKDQLDDFKKLLFNPDAKAINLFMLNIANDQKIKCPMCEKYVNWIELVSK